MLSVNQYKLLNLRINTSTKTCVISQPSTFDLTDSIPQLPSAQEMFRAMTCTHDKHAPCVKSRIRDCSSTLWYSAIGPQLMETNRLRRKAERKWRKTKLAADRLVF